MPSPLVLALGFVLGAYAFLSALLHLTQDAKEPPMIETSIPFVSPLLGLILGMQKFVVELRDKYNLPIYTLRILGQRFYIVNSPSLIGQLQRLNKVIAFAPVEAQAAEMVMGVGPAGNAIIGSDKMFENDSYLSTFVPSTHPALAPGPGLDAISSGMARHLSDAMEKLSKSNPVTVELFSWVRGEIFKAITDSTYGPKNPFRDPALETAWFTFEPDILTHMVKAWPSLLARKSFHAREHVIIPALEKYFAENGHLRGSRLVQCRYEHNTSHGIQGRDIAATEIGQMVASLTNSMGSAFWMVYHVFSDPIVLEECRAEAEQLVQLDGNDVQTIDLAKIRSSCPVLFSTWQEVLRYTHIGVGARVVMEDTILDNKYLLKKGANVMVVAPVQNTDTSVWGTTSGRFDHRRFVCGPGEKRKTPFAFRPFGGGAVLCPGRHFVTAGVLSFVILLLLRFDLKPANKNGRWLELRKKMSMTTAMPTPKDEMRVKLVPRDKQRAHLDISTNARSAFY
ncbi:hypothetical protein PABG_01648 [Paracoccidioides brasiliensis Pb03]|uniref:Cytochrome P450 oxidoreductase n=2 Tax=Paracoccidioides brasiliensis TaxID=121759 RepID=C1G927_PARBD|nr:uncharacterized protein PADG_03763 [Paracoccidioides brasiliensis Pb18]EEH19329.1 hypothetical protein PABG_01648 [Paracoccidioides brasiliensis Pb03]EEH47679.1 hypothetical protein PADG_03763 [Paracoccidioides brasiliensis Pb18]ODH45107.1 hypothetical protein ACO22_00402 [Paracoccidioides brasiliensis]ODH49722.1 hypothetical protein GX48_04100 [Paracoccidioides brasiliensis]